MRIILIEDDDIKRAEVCEFLGAWYTSATIAVARSYNSGLELVLREKADLILLDMTLTTFDVTADEDGGTPRKFAGMELLGQMNRFDVSTPVIVLTQYDFFEEHDYAATLAELSERLQHSYPDNYRGSVYYNQASDEWKGALVARIRDVLGVTQ